MIRQNKKVALSIPGLGKLKKFGPTRHRLCLNEESQGSFERLKKVFVVVNVVVNVVVVVVVVVVVFVVARN